MGSDVELLGVDEAEPPRPAPHRRYGVAIAVALAVGLGLFASVSVGRDADDTAPGPDTSSTATTVTASSSTAAEPSITTRPSTVEAESGDDLDPAVSLLPGSTELDSPLAVTTFPAANRPRPLWIIEPGRLISRADIPLAPGDWPHPLIFRAEHLAFVNPPDANLLPRELERPAEAIVPARYLVPGNTAHFAWAINDRITQITGIDLTSGAIGPTLDLPPDTNWVLGAVGDGFIILTRANVQAYWQPGEPPRPLPLPDPGQSGINGMDGSTVAIVSPGPIISILDVKTEQRVDVAVDIGPGHVSAVCLSPNHRYAVVVGSVGASAVIDFRTETVVSTLTTTQEFNGVAWTSENQFAYVSDDVIIATDPAGQNDVAVADIRGEHWWMTGSATTC